MIDASALQMVLLVLTGWVEHRERDTIAYLIEENRLLRRQLGGRRLRLTEVDRWKHVARAYRLGRQALREVATIVTPDTLLRRTLSRPSVTRLQELARFSGPGVHDRHRTAQLR